MKEFWDNRYANDEYAYGLQPNEFFKQELLKRKPQSILFPAEGEGRNAVFAAKNGWNVKAFDFSLSAKEKALKLAKRQGVVIDYEIANFDEFNAPANSFDCIVLIHAHTPALKRYLYHKKVVEFLKPGGSLILEGFKELKEIKIKTLETELNEGTFHRGTASVIRLIGKK